MTINVICPGCKKRFSVDDKFAGKKGPCPKCKTVIEIPTKAEEVKVHAPDEFGPKGVSGQAVLKPIARTETRFSVKLAVLITVGVAAAVLAAWHWRVGKGEQASWLILSLGALILAPPLAWAGYTFLRDEELEPYRGRELLIRVNSCALVYAVIWGLLAVFTNYVFGGRLDLFAQAIAVAAMVGLGAFAAFASLDLDYGVGAMHYGLYLLVTVLLRLVMNLHAILPPTKLRG